VLLSHGVLADLSPHHEHAVPEHHIMKLPYSGGGVGLNLNSRLYILKADILSREPYLQFILLLLF
jgi:hypothetical protein